MHFKFYGINFLTEQPLKWVQLFKFKPPTISNISRAVEEEDIDDSDIDETYTSPGKFSVCEYSKQTCKYPGHVTAASRFGVRRFHIFILRKISHFHIFYIGSEEYVDTEDEEWEVEGLKRKPHCKGQ